MTKQVLTDLDFNNVSRINNLPDGVANSEPATVGQLKASSEGIAWKDSVRVSTQANINLLAPGATIDGVALGANERSLVRFQTNGAENGIYIYNDATTPMTRASDADSAAELKSAVVTVDEGTNSGTSFRQTQVSFVLGTDPNLWSSFGNVTPPASEGTQGKIQIATQTEVNTGTDDSKALTPLKLAQWSGRVKRIAFDIGDGISTLYTINHNFNTRDVNVMVRRNSGNYDVVETDVRINSVNSVDVLFSAAPSANQFRVIVVG